MQADLLVHVVDVSHPNAEEQILAVNTVLTELHADGKPTLMVFNKIDRLETPDLAQNYLERFPNAVAVSARTGDGFPALLAALGSQLRPIREFVELAIPHGAAAVIARLHAVAQVVERDYEGPTVRLKARIPPHLHAEFASYIVRELQSASD